ncbi:unnamed protein product [Ranitomeya imitator]|uniref:Uncharacterized protein n=1 Tax=Ranitomeya imitator TaxID=111125 RepID=A0ABN9MCF2_9NEOB|nr:unnamed protein product [Ranitomeya imitator]
MKFFTSLPQMFPVNHLCRRWSCWISVRLCDIFGRNGGKDLSAALYRSRWVFSNGGDHFTRNVKTSGLYSKDNYLFNQDLWDICLNPKDVVVFNVILFSMVIASTAISLILCGVQMINGLSGCLFGTCRNKD